MSGSVTWWGDEGDVGRVVCPSNKVGASLGWDIRKGCNVAKVTIVTKATPAAISQAIHARGCILIGEPRMGERHIRDRDAA